MNKLKIHKNCNISDLTNYGFKKDGTSYKMLVPLYTYYNYVVITAVFEVNPFEEYIKFEIKTQAGSLYSAYYDREFSNPSQNIVLNQSLKKLQKEIDRMYQYKIISEVRDICSV